MARGVVGVCISDEGLVTKESALSARKMRLSGFNPTLNGDVRLTETFRACNAFETLLSIAFRVLFPAVGGLLAPAPTPYLLPDVATAFLFEFIKLCCGVAVAAAALTEDLEKLIFSP